ncbi:MAG: PIN domain nuclease [Planctomycetota bacterium]|nr:PIN domain nuclease [Planctomycetota bacterium]
MAARARLTVVLVDTTVWVDLFRGAATAQVAALGRLIADGEDICTCGVILTEVLQGVREDSDFRRTVARFDAFLFLPMSRRTFVKAAELYRLLRRKGITIWKPLDCMIAAVSLEHDVPLLHNDRDFDPIAAHCGLRVIEACDGGR